jgi:aminopeptidase N
VSIVTDDPGIILSNFDTISYDKGASILRMMANFIGIETFNEGVAAYLNKHKFGNAAKVQKQCTTFKSLKLSQTCL